MMYEPWNGLTHTIFFRECCFLLNLFSNKFTILTQTETTECNITHIPRKAFLSDDPNLLTIQLWLSLGASENSENSISKESGNIHVHHYPLGNGEWPREHHSPTVPATEAGLSLDTTTGLLEKQLQRNLGSSIGGCWPQN